MSAYLMAPRDLSVLANVPRQFGLPESPDAEAVYSALLDENLASIGYRYPDSPRISDWYDEGESLFIYDASAQAETATEALDLCRSYDYQSCEHPTYRESFASRYVEVLRACLEPLVAIEVHAKQEAQALKARAYSELPSLCPKETAAIIRGVLRKTFPACKFSVVTKRGSMVSSVRISWTDGPTAARVESLVGGFEAGRFDGMTDSYDYDNSRHIIIDGKRYRPGTRYVTCERKISAPLANRCIAQLVEYWGGVTDVPTANPGYFGHELGGYAWKPIRPDLAGCNVEWQSAIRQAAEDRTRFTRNS